MDGESKHEQPRNADRMRINSIKKRRRMYEERQRIIYGVDKISDVIYRDDPACQDQYLFDILRAHYGSMRYGHRRAYLIMIEMHIVAYKRVRDLTYLQREWLAKRLG